MKKIAAFIAVMVAVAGLTLFALQMLHRRTPYLPTRPTGVPVDATYIQGTNGKGSWDWFFVSIIMFIAEFAA